MPKGIYKRSKEQLEKLKSVAIQKGQKLSLSHRKAISDGHLGPKNHKWLGGRRKRLDGYFLVMDHSHPFNNKGYVLEHRLVMEKHLGRYLKKEEVVHHINENPSDNRIENLKLCANNAEHRKEHARINAKGQGKGLVSK